MARQLSGFTFPGLGPIPAAYAKVIDIDEDRANQKVVITLGIWYSKALRDADQSFLQALEFTISGAAYTTLMSEAPQPGADGTVPTTSGNIEIADAYDALAADPDAQTLLAGSTAV